MIESNKHSMAIELDLLCVELLTQNPRDGERAVHLMHDAAAIIDRLGLALHGALDVISMSDMTQAKADYFLYCADIGICPANAYCDVSKEGARDDGHSARVADRC